MLQKSSPPAQLRSLASSAKAPGSGNSGRQEPGAALPWEEGEAKPNRASKPMWTHPGSHSDPTGPPPTLPRHARATPVPTFAGGGREAGSQSDDDGERGRQIPLCPCHDPAGPPGMGQGHLDCPSTSASERPELRHKPANAKALCAHCSHPHRRAARQGGSSLPVTARKPMGWVGSAASPPSRTTRARCTQPEHPSGRWALAPHCHPSSLPRNARAAPTASRAPQPSSLFLSSCCKSQTCSLSCGPVGSSALSWGQV